MTFRFIHDPNAQKGGPYAIGPVVFRFEAEYKKAQDKIVRYAQAKTRNHFVTFDDIDDALNKEARYRGDVFILSALGFTTDQLQSLDYLQRAGVPDESFDHILKMIYMKIKMQVSKRRRGF